MKKVFLISIILMALAIFFPGCTSYEEYHFDGKINGEDVVFWEDDFFLTSHLTIKKIDGTKIKYNDDRKDLKLDSIKITLPDGKITHYWASSENPIVKEIIKEGQKQFDAYLAKIHEINSAPLLK